MDDSYQIITGPTVARLQRERIEKWDRRFLAMVDLVGSWSHDPSTKVGAVITRPDNTVASIGYNGFPRGMSDAADLYANREVKYSRIVHGEMNAILNAHGGVLGCTLYVPMLCCDRCAVHVIQAGIKRVVCREPSADMMSRWASAFEATRAMFAEAGVEIVEYPIEPPVDLRELIPQFDTHGSSMQIDVRMPSVDGERVCHGRVLLDTLLLDSLTNIMTDAARQQLVRMVLMKGERSALGFG